MGRKQKVLLNISITLLYQIIITISSLILPRILLKYYGSETNGVIASITRFLSIVSVLRLGVAGATRVELYKALARKDNKKTSGIINCTQNYMRGAAVAILGYIVALAIIFPFICKTYISNIDIILLVFIIGAGYFAEYYFGLTYQILLDADQSIYVYYLIQSLVVILNTILSTILALNGENIVIVKLVSISVFFITPVFLFVFCRKKYCIDKKCSPDNTALKNRKYVVAQSIANIIHDNVDVVVLTLFSSPLIVSVYTIYNLIIAALHNMFSIFVTGTESFFGNMFANKEYSKINLSLNLFEACVSMFVCIVFPVALLMTIPFVKLYTEGVTDTNYINYKYAFVALMALLFQCIREPYRAIVQADGKYKETKNGAIAEAVINLVASIVGVYVWGIVGVAIGTLVANVFRTLQYIVFVYKNMLKRKLSNIVKIFAFIFGGSVLICACGKIVIDYNSIKNWNSWILCSVKLVFISLSVTFLSGVFVFKKEIVQIIDIFRKRRV